MTMLSISTIQPTQGLGAVLNGRFRRGDYVASIQPLAAKGFNPGSRLSVVTLHGMVECPTVWTPVVETIAANFRDGHIMSLPWHGDDGCLWGHQAAPDEWLEPLWDALPPGRKIVLAHSFGANVLLELMNRRQLPGLRALVMVSPYYKQRYENFDWELFCHYIVGFDAFLEASIRIRPGAVRLHPQSLSEVAKRIKRKFGSFSWVEFFTLFSRTPGLRLEALDLPVLVMGGDRDLSVPVKDLEALVSRLPDARLCVLHDCGHFGMIEKPAASSRKIQSFLDDMKEC